MRSSLQASVTQIAVRPISFCSPPLVSRCTVSFFHTCKFFAKKLFLSNWLTLIFSNINFRWIFVNAIWLITPLELKSSKFTLRWPLHKLGCNYFCFIICRFNTAHFAFLNEGSQQLYNISIPHISSKMCSVVHLLGNSRLEGWLEAFILSLVI